MATLNASNNLISTQSNTNHLNRILRYFLNQLDQKYSIINEFLMYIFVSLVLLVDGPRCTAAHIRWSVVTIAHTHTHTHCNVGMRIATNWMVQLAPSTKRIRAATTRFINTTFSYSHARLLISMFSLVADNRWLSQLAQHCWRRRRSRSQAEEYAKNLVVFTFIIIWQIFWRKKQMA